MNLRFDRNNDTVSAEELAARKARLSELKNRFVDDVSPYVSALVHHDGDKVQAFVPADSLVSRKSLSFFGMFRVDLRFDLRQPVNQWLGIALLGCITVLVLLYYFTHKAFAIAGNISSLTVN